MDFNLVSEKMATFHFCMNDHLGFFDLGSESIGEDKRVILFREIIAYLQGSLSFRKEEDGSISTYFSIDVERSNKYSKSRDGEVFLIGESYQQDIEGGHHKKITPDDLWQHFGEDESLMRSLLKDFIDYYPIAVADMMIAIKEKDGTMLESHASNLYGVISYFPYFNSIERVLLLKKYGQFNRFHKAEEELYSLITELRKFEIAVDEVLLNLKTVA